MIIKVRTLTGKEIEVDIEPEEKAILIKNKIEQLDGIPSEQQRLIYCGRQLPDQKTIQELKIEGGSVLHLVIALRGG